MRPRARTWIVTACVGLVAIACGGASTDDTTVPSVTTQASTSTDAATTTAGTATTATTPPSTAAASTTTTGVQVSCVGFTSLGTTPGAATLTFARDGRLWAQDADGAATCLIDLPGEQATQAYRWRPAGDAVLFTDGAVVGAQGLVRPAQAVQGPAISWTRPSGTSTLLVDGARLLKVSLDGSVTDTLTPLDVHTAAAYHPDGTTIAVAGSRDAVQHGIWVTSNTGDDAQSLAFAEEGVTISDMTFTTDARWLVFVADHTDDRFSSGHHLHTIPVVPLELEDGNMALGVGGEFDAVAHVVSDAPLDGIVVPSDGSGTGDFPEVIALAKGSCGPDRRALLVDPAAETTVVLLDQPGTPVGFLPASGSEVRIVVATSPDGCEGPFDWTEVIVDADGSVSSGVSGTGADALAVHAVAPTVDITLSGVVIEPFA